MKADVKKSEDVKRNNDETLLEFGDQKYFKLNFGATPRHSIHSIC